MRTLDKFLTAKLNPPTIGVDTIWRKRLIETFNDYEYKKLTVVSAPTGYGKTVLISQVASLREKPVVWYQLDELDNDFVLFIEYFIAGISRKILHYGLQTLDFVNKNEDIIKHIRSIVVLLINELEARVEDGLTIILDDYHLIHKKEIHKFVEELIQYLPQKVHLIISSRYVLPINISRIKAHGLINEITYEHLKFNKEEIRSFFNLQTNQEVSEDVIEKYELTTGGWPIALSLIKAVSMGTKNKKNDMSLQWQNRKDIYDYFVEEVFRQLPIELRTFLIDTSVLDVLIPDLCNELTGTKDSHSMLGNLLNHNIFLIRIEDEEGNDSYRYHHLFLVVFNYKGQWTEALLQIDEALQIVTLSDNREEFINTSFQKSIVLRRAGQIQESLNVLDEIRLSVQAFPIMKWYDILLEKANTLLWCGALNETVKTLKKGIEFSNRDHENRLIAFFMEHLGATYYAMGEYYEAIEYYNASNRKYLLDSNSLSEYEKERYSQRTTLASIYRDWAELDKALELIREEISTKERLGLTDDLPRAYHQLALIYNDLGDKDAAERQFRFANELYKKLDRKDFQWTWHLALFGKILLDNGKKKEGKELVEKGIKQARKNSEFNLAVCEFVGCYAYIEDGNTYETIKLLEHALKVGKKVGAKNLICQCDWILSNLHLKMGNEPKARTYMGQCFALAREGNYLQVFLSYEQTSFPIIKLAIEMGMEEEFLEKIVLKLGRKAETMLLELRESNDPKIQSRADVLLEKVEQDNGLVKQKCELELKNKIEVLKERLRVCCMGNFEVYNLGNETLVHWKTGKAKELFAYFMKNSNKAIVKEKILEDLWPDMDPQQTSVRLHTYIYQIRTILKKSGIDKGLIYKDKAYCLKREGICSDVDEFEGLFKDAMRQSKGNQVETLEKAIRLYKGEYLEGYYNGWILAEKERLECIFIKMIERLAERYMEKNEYKQAIHYLQMLLEIDPLLEKTHEMLMTAYKNSNDRIAAVKQYENYCNILEHELGIEPKKEMKRLYEQIL